MTDSTLDTEKFGVFFPLVSTKATESYFVSPGIRRSLQIRMRTTRGFGTLISFSVGKNLVRRDLNHRLKVEELGPYGQYTFIRNENVHNTGRRLRGILVATYYDVGYIVKAEGRRAVYQPLLPHKGDLRLVDLYDPNILPLQQVGGPLVYDATKMCKCKQDQFGHVCKSPNGPDTIFCSTTEIPSSFTECLQRSSFTCGSDDTKVPKKTYCPKFVQVVYVLCTEQTRRSVDKSKESRRYSIHCGPLQKVSKW